VKKGENIVVTVIMWIVLLVLIAFFLYLRFRPMPGMRSLGADEYQTAFQAEPSHMLIDVREPAEFSHGHIKGAVNVPLSHLAGRIGNIPRDKTLFLYCQSGARSHQAARMLSAQGFTGLVNLKGGIAKWRGAIEK
jgi:rhodanese-related sulfurtransferase